VYGQCNDGGGGDGSGVVADTTLLADSVDGLSHLGITPSTIRGRGSTVGVPLAGCTTPDNISAQGIRTQARLHHVQGEESREWSNSPGNQWEALSFSGVFFDKIDNL
jgi:hypothetical protein